MMGWVMGLIPKIAERIEIRLLGAGESVVWQMTMPVQKIVDLVTAQGILVPDVSYRHVVHRLISMQANRASLTDEQIEHELLEIRVIIESWRAS